MSADETPPQWTRVRGFQKTGDRARKPSFDIDWKYGVTDGGEAMVREICGQVDGGNARIEVKRKRRSDGYFYVELEHDPGRRGSFVPSGLSVTTAEFWGFAIAESGVVLFVKTEMLEAAIDRNYGKPAKETDGSCPTHGRLLSFWDMLSASKPGAVSRAAFGGNFHVPA